MSRVGTLPYMSPQAIDNNQKYTYKCDIWSFGVVCYEFATGKLPWKYLSQDQSKFLEYLKKVCESGIDYPENVEKDLQDLINRCLKYKESDRINWPDIYRHNFFKGKF